MRRVGRWGPVGSEVEWVIVKRGTRWMRKGPRFERACRHWRVVMLPLPLLIQMNCMASFLVVVTS